MTSPHSNLLIYMQHSTSSQDRKTPSLYHCVYSSYATHTCVPPLVNSRSIYMRRLFTSAVAKMSARPVTLKTGHARALAPDGTTLAETKEWFEVEGNVYFPPGAVRRELFEGTDMSTYCPWKGDASYYDIKVGGELVAP